MSASQLSGTSASGKPEYVEETELSNEESSFEDEDEKAAGESSLVPMIIGGVGFLAVVVVGIVLCVCLCQKDDAEVTPAPSTTEQEVKMEEEIATPGEGEVDNLTRMERSKRSFSNGSTVIRNAPGKASNGSKIGSKTIFKRENRSKLGLGLLGLVAGVALAVVGLFSNVPAVGPVSAKASKYAVVGAGALLSVGSLCLSYKKMTGLEEVEGEKKVEGTESSNAVVTKEAEAAAVAETKDAK